MTLFGVSLAMVSHHRIPLVSEEELTGICVFRSCHTLFNFQGTPTAPGRLSAAARMAIFRCCSGRFVPVSRDSFAIIPRFSLFVNPLFSFFSLFSLFSLFSAILPFPLLFPPLRLPPLLSPGFPFLLLFPPFTFPFLLLFPSSCFSPLPPFRPHRKPPL